MDNIVEFPGELAPVRIEIPLGSVDQARRVLECVEVTIALAQKVIEKAENYDDEVILVGLRQLFAALNALIGQERQLQSVCGLPRFDPPDGAA